MKVLLATHGTLAQGMYSAAGIILGDLQGVDMINAYVDDHSLKEQLDAYFQTPADAPVLVLTDMFGGSVNQALMPYMQSHSITLVTGVNLPCVLELLSRRESLDLAGVREIVAQAQTQVLVVNDLMAQAADGDDFD